jgi:hypothetical protein
MIAAQPPVSGCWDIPLAALFCFVQSGKNRLVRLETALNA